MSARSKVRRVFSATYGTLDGRELRFDAQLEDKKCRDAFVAGAVAMLDRLRAHGARIMVANQCVTMFAQHHADDALSAVERYTKPPKKAGDEDGDP